MAMAFTSRAQYTETQPNSVNKAFTFEIPNFMQEAKLLARTRVDRKICSPVYPFNGFRFTFSGNITTKFTDGNLEFVNEIWPGYQSGICHDVEFVMDVMLQCKGFQYKCVEQSKSYGGLKSSPQQLRHYCSTSVPFSELKEAVPMQFEEKACLTIMVNLTVSGKATATSWAEAATAKCLPDTMNSSGSSPFLKQLLEKKHSDLVIECDGQQFPAHSLVLKCMSQVFTAMLATGMKEAATGRIKIQDVASTAVERMLEFIYNGTLFRNQDKNGELSDDLITELLHCAEKYEITEMKQQVMARMKIQLCTENALKFLKAAELYGAEESVLTEILEFCKRNLMELPKGPELQDFIVKNLKGLF